MINAVNQQYTGFLQSHGTGNAPKNLSEGQALQSQNQESHFDTIKLSPEAALQSPTLQMPSEMKTEKPRAWSIAIETVDSRINHIEDSLEKADSLNLSFGERLAFLKNDGMKWVDEIKRNDPEMFEQWLKMNNSFVMGGQ